jgi:hypothetical protein
MFSEIDSSWHPSTQHDFKLVHRSGKDNINWTNNYTLPWVTLFRSFPWTRQISLTTKDGNLFLNAYGSAFSDRASVNHVGQTIYQGARATLAVCLSPSMGGNKADCHQYNCKRAYIPPLMPSAEKIGNKLFNSSCLFMRWLDPAQDCLIKKYMDFSKRNHYCRVKIITQGVPTERTKKSTPSNNMTMTTPADNKTTPLVLPQKCPPKKTTSAPGEKGNQTKKATKKNWMETSDGLVECLGWASTDHTDLNDKLKPETQKVMMQSLEQWQPATENEKMVRDYLLKFGSRLGFGIPTCCGYKYIGMEADKGRQTIFTFNNIIKHGTVVIHHYFVTSGLKCCVRLRPKYGTFFYGHTFSHCTSLCVAVYNGRAYFTDHRFRAFAWGGGGT